MTHPFDVSIVRLVNIVSEYQQQVHYRAWARIFDALPDMHGQRVLDLGCGIGDQAAELVARGARVVGIDANEEFLAAARDRNLENAEFRYADLRAPLDVGHSVDGIWSSFVAAYFTDLVPTLTQWAKSLRPGGFVALTEIDDMFGHEPLLPRSVELLERYVQESLRVGRYDFRMGHKLRAGLETSGFDVTHEFSVPDHELAFDGPASGDVLDSWRNRFTRMKLLQAHCGVEFEPLRDDFLACLGREDHRCRARVFCAIGVLRPEC